MTRINVACQSWNFDKNIVNPNDLKEIIQGVARLGYDGMEVCWRHLDLSGPNDVAQCSKEFNLPITSLHLPLGMFSAQNFSQVEVALKSLVVDRLVISYIDQELYKTADGCAEAASLISDAYYVANPANVQPRYLVYYHTHEQEYVELEDGQLPIYVMMEALPPELKSRIKLEPDAGWIGNTGIEIYHHLLNKTLIHLKDLRFGHPPTFLPIGTGDLAEPIRKFVKINASSQVTKWYIVEQDEPSAPGQELVDAKFSIQNLRDWMAS